MKKLLTIVIAFPIVALSAGDITVWVDGTKVQFYDTHPTMIRGRVMVPLRGVFQQLDAKVSWDPATKIVTAEKEGYDVELSLNNPRAKVNGKEVILDSPPVEFRDRVLIPLRFIGEALGANVKWEKETAAVIIQTSPPPAYQSGRRALNRQLAPP